MGMRQHQDEKERAMAFMQYKYQEAFMRRAAQPSATSEPEAGDDFYQPRVMVVKWGGWGGGRSKKKLLLLFSSC